MGEKKTYKSAQAAEAAQKRRKKKNDPKKTVENSSRTHTDSSGNKQASCIQLPKKTLPSPTGNSKKNTLGSQFSGWPGSRRKMHTLGHHPRSWELGARAP